MLLWTKERRAAFEALHHAIAGEEQLHWQSSNISWALESWVPDSRGFYVLLPLMDFN